MLRGPWATLALLAAGLALGGVGAALATRSPGVRVEERQVDVGRVTVTARWEWAVRYPEGNAVWAPGAVQGSDRPLYPLAGRATLEAVPVLEVHAEPEAPVRAGARYEAALRAAQGGGAIWERTAARQEARWDGGSGAYRGRALEVNVVDAKRALEETNKALGLLDRYDSEILFSLRGTVEAYGKRMEVLLASPVRVHPDGFSLPPPEARTKQEEVTAQELRTVEVPKTWQDRVLEEAWWFGGALACVAAALALERRRRLGKDLEHRRHRAWIVGGRVDFDPRTTSIVEVESLRALVRIAHDAGCRVIHDRRVGYVVADRGTYYVFRPGSVARIGELLARQGLLTADDVEEAGQKQAALRRPVGECLIALGFVDEAAVYAALAYQRGLRYVEPDPGVAPRPARLPVPARVLGRRPDGPWVVAVADPLVAPELLAEVLGGPVDLVLTRPAALGGLPEAEEATGEVNVDRRARRALREYGFTLGALLYVSGYVPEPLELDDRTVYRQAIRSGLVHPDALHLAAVLAAHARRGKAPDLVELLSGALRLPDAVAARVRDWDEEALVRWLYVSEATLRRAKRLLVALQGCVEARTA